MKNSHLRMGTLRFTKTLRDTTIDITVTVDRMIAEAEGRGGEAVRCHLLSVLGSDQEVAAIAAAIADEGRFSVTGAGITRLMIAMGSDVETFRSSISIPGRKRPIRHLVAVSEALARTRPGGDPRARRTILCDDDPSFLLHRLGVRFGLPVLPEWSDWFGGLLAQRKAVENLLGIGCNPVAVKGTKKRFLGWIGHGLKRGAITIPDCNERAPWHLRSWFSFDVGDALTAAGASSVAGSSSENADV